MELLEHMRDLEKRNNWTYRNDHDERNHRDKDHNKKYRDGSVHRPRHNEDDITHRIKAEAPIIQWNSWP